MTTDNTAPPTTMQKAMLSLMQGGMLSHGQVGQDFWIFGEAFNGLQGGYFVDIGAHDGVFISNTVVLEQVFGWTGLLVEANPETFETLKKNRTSTCLNLCLDKEEGEIEFALRGPLGGIVGEALDNAAGGDEGGTIRMKTRPLIDVLDEHKAPESIEFLSIDVEGAEERILMDFDFDRYQFKCMTLERPSAALRARLQEKNYRRVREIPVLDTLFIHRDFAKEYRTNMMNFYRGATKLRITPSDD